MRDAVYEMTASQPSALGLADLDGLLPQAIRTSWTPVANHIAALVSVEQAYLSDSGPARQLEFSTGRWLARRLLAELGEFPAPIGRGEDRAPCWPAGIVGSISHSGGVCAVAVARATEFLGVGIDVEPDESVKTGLERMICFDEELDWIELAGETERGRRCRIVFSAKEAVYKAFYPRVRRIWRFSEVRLEVDLARGSFVARLPTDSGINQIDGRLLRRAGWIVTAVADPVRS